MESAEVETGQQKVFGNIIFAGFLVFGNIIFVTTQSQKKQSP